MCLLTPPPQAKIEAPLPMRARIPHPTISIFSSLTARITSNSRQQAKMATLTETVAAEKLQAVWRGYQVRKSVWSYEEQYCECGEPATVCGECADCFWENQKEARRTRWEERHGVIVPRFPCNGCGKLLREQQMLALDGESYCERCFNEALAAPRPIEELSEADIYEQLHELDQERKQLRREGREDTEEYAVMDRAAQALADELTRRDAEDEAEDEAEAKANTYYRRPLHCCGDAHCDGSCDTQYCGCQGKCRCDAELTAWRDEEDGEW